MLRRLMKPAENFYEYITYIMKKLFDTLLPL